MCTVFLVETDDGFDECNTIGELKEAIGVGRIAFRIEPYDYTDRECLCNVDAKATAIRCGMTLEDDGVFYTLRKASM